MRIHHLVASAILFAACAGPTTAQQRQQQQQQQQQPSTQAPRISATYYDKASESFRGTMLTTVKLALRAIQELGWKVESANENLGLVAFETPMSFGSWSGISATLLIEEISPGAFRVTGTSKQNTRGGQLLHSISAEKPRARFVML
jgi:hypothetical protein